MITALIIILMAKGKTTVLDIERENRFHYSAKASIKKRWPMSYM
jgi:hypothetical protein